MRRNLFITTILLGTIVTGFCLPGSMSVYAEDATVGQINALQDSITSKQARLEELQKKLEQYKNLIRQKESESASLEETLATLDNRITKAQLDIEATELETEELSEQITLLELQITQSTKDAARQRALLASMLRMIKQSREVSLLEVLFGHQNFSQVFEQLRQLESVNTDLHQTLEGTKKIKADLSSKRAEKTDKLAVLEQLKRQLELEKNQLQEEQGSKEYLLIQTQQNEAQYRALVNELKQEQDFVGQQVLNLQQKVQNKLQGIDDTSFSSTLLSWPVSQYVLTTKFHDPSYPFRYLFEHSGLDLAIPVGTPVRSAAPGYVALARTGSMYGNYVMIIHGNGLATLYAHLSKIEVQPDQYVARGEEIALSGGAAGAPGSGFSTGPHLHFEIRLDGIPVDPFGYLVSR